MNLVCNTCQVDMVVGQAMIPIWGRLDGAPAQRGDTLNQVGAALGPCYKCPKCGHSVSAKVEINTEAAIS